MKRNILFLTIVTLFFSACKSDKEEVLPKSARIISAFSVDGQVGNTINEYSDESGNLTVYVEEGTNTTNIKPEITISDKASISPAIGAPVSFTLEEPFVYTVTAQSGLDLKWNVTLHKYVAPAITSFGAGIPNETIIEDGKITVHYRKGAVITAIPAVVDVTPGSTVTPASRTPRNFTNPQTYTVKHATGSSQSYIVTFVEH